jgi:monovalent cation:H+ antiporter-2, CPA2 family
VLITVVVGPIIARVPDFEWFKALLRPRSAPGPALAADGPVTQLTETEDPLSRHTPDATGK